MTRNTWIEWDFYVVTIAFHAPPNTYYCIRHVAFKNVFFSNKFCGNQRGREHTHTGQEKWFDPDSYESGGIIWCTIARASNMSIKSIFENDACVVFMSWHTGTIYARNTARERKENPQYSGTVSFFPSTLTYFLPLPTLFEHVKTHKNNFFKRHTIS